MRLTMPRHQIRNSRALLHLYDAALPILEVRGHSGLTVQMGQNPGNHRDCKDKHPEPTMRETFQVCQTENPFGFCPCTFPCGLQQQNRQMSDTVNKPLANLIQSRLPEVIFTNWREVLHSSSIARHILAAYEHGVGRFLEYCVLNGASVTRQSASDFLADAHRRDLAPPNGQWEQGIDWFFVNGQARCAPHPDGVPSMGKADLGKSAWERRLIERLRLQHYSWRTEQTY